MGRALNLIDPVGSSNVSSVSVAQIELRFFGTHSSSFPPDFFVFRSRVFFQVDNVVVFCPAVLRIAVNQNLWGCKERGLYLNSSGGNPSFS